MRRGIGIVLIVGAVAASFALGRVYAQEDGGAAADMQKAWTELGKPGPEHAEFKKIAGDWTCVVKSWHGPGEPTVSKAKTKFSVVLGGLILRQDYEGVMGDTPFTGLGFTAFNNGTGKYEAIWMDSGSTGIAFMNGTETEKNKVFEYKGHFFGPGGAKITSRSIMKRVDDDTQTMEMYMNMGQGEMKAMEITYKRVK